MKNFKNISKLLAVFVISFAGAGFAPRQKYLYPRTACELTNCEAKVSFQEKQRFVSKSSSHQIDLPTGRAHRVQIRSAKVKAERDQWKREREANDFKKVYSLHKT